jgi:hypothetical protein
MYPESMQHVTHICGGPTHSIKMTVRRAGHLIRTRTDGRGITHVECEPCGSHDDDQNVPSILGLIEKHIAENPLLQSA